MRHAPRVRLLALLLIPLLQACPPSRCDADGDGVEALRCEGEDCNDASAAAFPGGDEVCDGVDNDCDGSIDGDDASGQPTWFRDADGDLFGDSGDTLSTCSRPAGYVAEAGDCDDTRTLVHPLATEVCNGVDDDCDGSVDGPDAALPSIWYADADGDGWGDASAPTESCVQPPGTADAAGDCDDGDPEAYPGAPEFCDGVDTDCDGVLDGTWFRDADEDGFGDASQPTDACLPPAGYVEDATDCDDAAGATWPGAPELCGDGADNDCVSGHDGSCGSVGAYTHAELPRLLDGSEHLVEGIGMASGDFDGDGVDDLAVAHLGPDEVVIYRGPFSRDQPPTELIRLPDPEGSSPGGFGSTLLGADVDGDGQDDLLITRSHPASLSGEQSVTLHLGPLVDADADAVLRAEGVFGFGHALALLPDTTGDGLPDLAVSLLDEYPASGWWSGGLYIFAGPLEGDLTLDDAVGSLAGWTGGLGWSLQAGDFDGDGLSDLAAGVPASSGQTGHVVVLAGPLTGDLGERLVGTVLGPDEGSHFGGGLGLVGDQLLVGGLWTGTAAPAAWLAELPWDGAELNAELPITSGALGIGASSGLGPIAARDLGDFDGDGAADLVLAATNPSSTGGTLAIRPTFLDEPGSPITSLVGPGWPAWPGWLHAPGDLDGDGFDDVLLCLVQGYEQDGQGLGVLWGGPGL